jgi:SAM-dependent methyltransferase
VDSFLKPQGYKYWIMQTFVKRITSLWFRKLNRKFIDDEWRESDLVCHRESLASQWLRGDGIEIGALHKPLKLKDGVTVRYIDYKTKAESQARYPELAMFDIVNTDIVDDGFVLNKIADHSLDFIIANHALEHTPDPYGTLLKWKSKLRHHGVLYFALPIVEKCYDRGRSLTSLAHLLDDHRLFSTSDTARILKVSEDHLREFLRISDANIRRENQIDHILDEQEIDEACNKLMVILKSSVATAKPNYNDLIKAHVLHLNKAYDIHYHTFSPTSLYAFVTYFCDREKCEFIEIKKSGGGECIAIIRNR